MTVTTVAGPQVTYGLVLSSSGADLEHNPDRGPSFADLGEGLLDPRPPFCFQPGAASSHAFYGWAGLFGGPVVDQAPSATSTNVIVATQTTTSAGAGGLTLTLNAVTSNGFGAATTINAYEGGTVSVRPIDGAMTGLAFGVSGGPNLWNPTTAVSRTITVYPSSGPETFSVFGRDIYGQKMTETRTASSAGAPVAFQKAYKYIAQIIAGTSGGAGSTGVIVGTNDVFGFPLRVDHPAYVTAWAGPGSSATLVTVSTGAHTYAVTSTPTSTTGDVRGTIGTSTITGTVSNSSNWKIVMFISPSAQNLQAVSLGSSYPNGIVGLQQFSST